MRNTNTQADFCFSSEDLQSLPLGHVVAAFGLQTAPHEAATVVGRKASADLQALFDAVSDDTDATDGADDVWA